MTEKPEQSDLEKAIAATNGKVGVSRMAKDWQEQWDTTIGMSPQALYDIWAKDLPEDTTIYIELNSNGHAEYRMHSSAFELEGYFSRNHGHMHIKELRVNETQRRGGTGKTILRNHVNIGESWGMKDINLRGGREDGPFFWSKRGAVLEDHAKLRENFARQVQSNADKLDLPDETLKKLADILERGDVTMNFEIASLGQTIDGVPVGVALLRETNPRVEFHLDDSDQMAIVRQNLTMK